MFRLLLLISLCCAPCFAVAPGDDGKLALESLTVVIQLSRNDDKFAVETSCTAALHNTGEALDTSLWLPAELVPKDKRKEFTLSIDGNAKPADSDKHSRLTWQLHLEADQTVLVHWTRTTGATPLPQADPRGLQQLTVRLGYMQGFTKLPDAFDVTIRHEDLPPELFSQTEDGPTSISEPVKQRMQDYDWRWFNTTLEEQTAAIVKLRDSFSDAQLTYENRSYTETLVRLVELYELAGDNKSVAATCETLALLEGVAGHAITHCGPWAQWRKYVPWQLRRIRALSDNASDDRKEAAKQAVAIMASRWASYVDASKSARPFDQFDAAKFGNYWDYDWTTTQKLYADALALTGDTDGAEAVRAVKHPD